MAGPSVAERLQDVIVRLFGMPAPVRIHAWDGSSAGPPDAPVVYVRSRRALRRMLWRPDELGLARAYVAGEIDVAGDLLSVIEHLAPFGRRIGREPELSAADRRELLRTTIMLGAVGPAPKPPPEEEPPVPRRPEVARDRAATRAHDDLPAEFYATVLGPSLVYSCGIWDDVASLDAAQETKHELACRELELRPGKRVLDVGCGWGSFLIYAARHYGITGVGITVSADQAELATKRITEAGLADRVEIRVAHWREVEDAAYDGITAVGAADYVGIDAYDEYAATLARLLRPGGRLFVMQTTRRSVSLAPSRSFMDAYVFPDGALVPLGRMVGAYEDAGLEVRRTASIREHYARTLRAWANNLEANWSRCVEQTSPGRARAWRLYLAASVLAFDSARIGAQRMLAVRPYADGRVTD